MSGFAALHCAWNRRLAGWQLSERDAHFSMHGVHARNYHIMTPAVGKDWALAWGCNSYVKDVPYANAAYNYNFKPGESGNLTLEFWTTPFDYAGCEGRDYIVTLEVEGPEGKSRREKIWDVSLR